MNVVKRRILIESLPTDIPKILEADLQGTETGAVIKSQDLLGLPEKCKLLKKDVVIITLKGKKGATANNNSEDADNPEAENKE